MASYQYNDPTIDAYAAQWQAAKGNPALQASIHAQAEVYRMTLNPGYKGSKDGSTFTFTGPAVLHTASNYPKSSAVEKVAEKVEKTTGTTADATEAVGQTNGSNTQIPSSNLTELKNAPSVFDMGKTTTGLTYVFGNVLDTFWAALSWIMGMVQTYAKPLLMIGSVLAVSKVISIRKR